jgi:hypothetical protein
MALSPNADRPASLPAIVVTDERYAQRMLMFSPGPQITGGAA